MLSALRIYDGSGVWVKPEAADHMMKPLLVNPPSIAKFDGGATVRYQATREITSFGYPVWLAYPAGLVQDSRFLDGPGQGVSSEDAVAIAQDSAFVDLYTSIAGFKSDLRIAAPIRTDNPAITIAFCPHATVQAEESREASESYSRRPRRFAAMTLPSHGVMR